jgi:hypothetical protein
LSLLRDVSHNEGEASGGRSSSRTMIKAYTHNDHDPDREDREA